LIITIMALRAGLFGVVKASIAGSIIGNVLVVLGASLLVGGLKHGIQTFDARAAGANATMMILAVVALSIPAVFAHGSPEQTTDPEHIQFISDGMAVVLIVIVSTLGQSLKTSFSRTNTGVTNANTANASSTPGGPVATP
jgi:Ca2+:H+ antiporter